MTGERALAQALEELYAAPPDTFTRTRAALACRLREEGAAEAAEAITHRRKPTQVAFVLNQLARRHPQEVAALVDVGRSLARAQRRALREGDGGELREAIAEQRRTIGELTRKTAALMRDLGVTQAGHTDEIAGALQAALVDPAIGARLEEGRLEKVPEPSSSFPSLPPGEEPKKVRRDHAAERRAQEDARRKEAARLAEDATRLEEQARHLEERAAEAREAAIKARAAARAARARQERFATSAKRTPRR